MTKMLKKLSADGVIFLVGLGKQPVVQRGTEEVAVEGLCRGRGQKQRDLCSDLNGL